MTAPVDMYAAYVRERTDGDVMIDPGKGFATWTQRVPEAVYIVDIYVAPEHRKSGVAAGLADKIAAIAIARGATKLIGSVDVRTKTRTEATKALLAYGFQIDGTEGATLWFSKEIG